MNNEICTREPAILEAARSGTWQEDLKLHLEQCPDCAEAALVASFLAAEASAGTTGRPLPDPGPIWQRAQHHARQRDLRRALRPIELVETAAAACGTAAALGGLLWLGPIVRGWFTHLSPTLPEPSLALLPGTASIMAIGAILAAGTLVSEIYSAWTK